MVQGLAEDAGMGTRSYKGVRSDLSGGGLWEVLSEMPW